MKRIFQIGFLLLCLSVCLSAQTNKFPYDKADMPFNAQPVERRNGALMRVSKTLLTHVETISFPDDFQIGHLGMSLCSR
jgi:hypothetical protein